MPVPEFPDHSASAPNGGENPKAGNRGNEESVFSQRSGIQDPLIKSGKTEEEGVEEESASAKPTGGAIITESRPETTPDEDSPDPKKKHLKSKRQLNRVRRRQMNYLQQRRQKKKLRVFYSRIRVIVKLCFAILWAILLWEMVHSPLWTYQQPQFELKNAKLIQAKQIQPIIQSQVGKPIYTIDTGKLAHRIEKRFPWVAKAVVRRKLFPARLQVQVVEKQPWATLMLPPNVPTHSNPFNPKPKAIATNQAKANSAPKAEKPPTPYALMTNNEILSLQGYTYQAKLYPGIETLWVKPGTVFRQSEMQHLREIIWQAHQIPGLHLKAVDLRNKNQIVLYYQEIPVILGKLNDSASHRLARLLLLVPKIREYQSVIESVDLKWEEQVTFHKQPDAEMKLPKPEKVQG